MRLAKRFSFKTALFLGFVGGLSGFALWRILGPEPQPTRDQIAEAIRLEGVHTTPQNLADKKQRGVFQRLPEDLEWRTTEKHKTVRVTYALDADLQSELEQVFQQYMPEYGALVALDPQTGRILALIGYLGPGKPILKEHFALRASFPSASVFKVVTAAAAIAERRFSSNSPLVVSGRDHTLYRHQIFGRNKNADGQIRDRNSRLVTLKEAFGRSINSVFGRLGVFNLGPGIVQDYAERFGFNRAIASDLPVEAGRAEISEDPYQLAEATSGFTQKNTMSPLQGALIASAIVNNGKLVEPSAIEKIVDDQGEILYEFDMQAEISRRTRRVLPEKSIPEMRELMAQTVTKGTSRQSFRGFHRSKYSVVDVGGKTGSLTGRDPPGKYDWFVGYGSYRKKKIALSVLTIHGDYWTVKSAYIARKAIEHFFDKDLD